MPAICAVKEEAYIPSPEKRVTPTASISYIGEGLRREEVRTFVRSSDWIFSGLRNLSMITTFTVSSH